MAFKNTSLYAVLGMLSLRPMSGYDIKKTIESSVSNFWNESFGQIYPMLQKLVEEGLATESRTLIDARKREYAITPRGRAVLRAWIEEPARIQPSRNETLLKIFLAVESGPRAAIDHVRRMRRHHLAARERYRALEKYLNEKHPKTPSLPYWLITLRYGLLESEALLAWCEEAEQPINTIIRKDKRTDA